MIKISPTILGKMLLSGNKSIQYQDRKNIFILLKSVKEWVGEDVDGFPLISFKELFEQIELLATMGITERVLVFQKLKETFSDEMNLGEDAQEFLNLFPEINSTTVEQIRILIENELKALEIVPTLNRKQELIVMIETSSGATRDKYLKEYEDLIHKEMRRLKTVKVSTSGINSMFLNGNSLRELASANFEEINDESCMLKCGIPQFDKMFGGGLKNGTATIIGAPTGNFKSGTLLNIALGICQSNRNVLLKDKTKKPFLQYISHENKPTLTFRRFVKYVLNLSEEETRNIAPEKLSEMIEKTQEDWGIRIKIDYIRSYTMEADKVTSLINGITDEEGNEMECVGVFHDYLFLLKTDLSDYRLALSKNMRILADIAIEEGIPVVTLAQLNAEAELVKHLSIRTVGESKAILQHCDDVILQRLQSYIPITPPNNILIPEGTNKFKYLEVYHAKARSLEDHDQSRILIPFSLTNSFKLATDNSDSLFAIVDKTDLERELNEKYEISRSKKSPEQKPVFKAVNSDVMFENTPEDDEY